MGQSVEVLTADLAGSSAIEGGHAGPTAGTERTLADILADLLQVQRVPVDGHFFDELGADSMVMAQFCARVRKRAGLPAVSMKDIYRHPTIAGLAAALAPAGAPAVAESPVPASAVPASTGVAAGVAHRASTGQYVLCGVLQLLVFVGYTYLGALVAARGYGWISRGSGLVDFYLRSVLFGGAAFVGLCTLPIVAKWLLVGRWRSAQIPVWSLAYLRFWVVKTLVRANPLVLLIVGSPLYGWYLRALGAKVGRGVAIFSRNLPVCTDLLTIGDNTVIRKDSYLNGYRAHAGLIQTGPVTLGRDVFVGEATVLDIDTSLGDGAQLGHSSSLHAGQAVPAGQRWHGSPAQPTEVDYRGVAPADCRTLRRAVYVFLQLLSVLVVYLPLTIGGLGLLLAAFPKLSALLGAGPLALTSWTFYRDALVASVVLFCGGVLGGPLLVVAVPRLLNLAIKPDRIYPLYGFHYSVHRAIARLTNIKFFTYLFGDSSYIVHYLRCLGYDLSRVEQTGSNFGSVLKHESPYLSSVGTGTMVADGLSIINADFSSTSFRVSRASIGARNFLGNHIAYPWQGKTGNNCLLATKVLVPIEGQVRENVGLLGSPSFEIPRSVLRDSRFDHLKSGDELPRRLRAKNKHNLASMGLALLVRWGYLFGLTLLASATAHFYPRFGSAALTAEILLSTLLTTVYFVLIERAGAGFRALRPQFCSIYDPYFWWHERYWKLVIPEYLDHRFVGTPFKNVISRLLGVRLGRRVFDDGCAMPEKTLASIGDDCMLNARSIVQCHSQEDGNFKSDRTAIGAGCTLGVGALVHYGVTIGDGAVLAPDSFLMKGEEVPAQARWGGNPAGEMPARETPAGKMSAREKPGGTGTPRVRRDSADHRGAVLVGAR